MGIARGVRSFVNSMVDELVWGDDFEIFSEMLDVRTTSPLTHWTIRAAVKWDM